MAYMSVKNNAIKSFHIADLMQQAKLAIKQKRAYRQTVRELDALSYRELNDLGINSGDIHNIARDAAKGTQL